MFVSDINEGYFEGSFTFSLHRLPHIRSGPLLWRGVQTRFRHSCSDELGALHSIATTCSTSKPSYPAVPTFFAEKLSKLHA